MNTIDNSTNDEGLLDETYLRLRTTGPEFDGWLSNHGPMAADALIRLGHGSDVERWVDQYLQRLEDAPTSRWEIRQDEWLDALGDPSRLADWIALFDRQLEEQPWQAVLIRWWPRLIDGAVASATHGLIRTGHAVRALITQPTPARVGELAQALGYWAARHQRLPGHPRPSGNADPDMALQAVPAIQTAGDINARLGDLSHTPSWPGTVARLHPITSPAEIPDALDAIVDAAVTRYRFWGHGNPIMLVHAATAPRAASLVLPALPLSLWIPTFEAAWAASVAITAVYRPVGQPPSTSGADERHSTEQVTEHAVATGDEHAIKFAEVAQDSHLRGNPNALASSDRANHLIAAIISR